MHYVTLAAVSIPPLAENEAENAVVAAEAEAVLEKYKDSFLEEFYRGIYKGRATTFSRAVESAVEMVMEPFYEQSEDPEFLVFEDHTEEIKEEYYHEGMTCFRLPDGRILSRYAKEVYGRFRVKDGVVKAESAGRLHIPKRNRKAKKLKLLENYPYRKLYDSWQTFAEGQGYVHDAETDGYGYRYNPDGHWDWYSIGGRWPCIFLVEETCAEVSLGDSANNPGPAPAGYKWVSAARKKDIAWAVMRSWKTQCAVERYELLRSSFAAGALPENVYGSITEEGIQSFGGFAYKKGETLDDYLTRFRIDDSDTRYPDSFYSYIDDGEWFSNYEYDYRDKTDDAAGQENWHNHLHDFIDSLPDDEVLVVVDCHT